MSTELGKRYNLATAIAMVIGIVIGSGVFFKAEKVLNATNGDLTLGILAWVIGGAIMVICAYAFATLAARYEKANGVVDYAEAAGGSTYGYAVGWFMTTIYYPSLTGVLAWASAKYTSVLFSFENADTGAETFMIAGFYLVVIYALNAIAPILSGKFQVSTTAIKLIPLSLLAIAGTFAGMSSGQIAANFAAVTAEATTANPLLTSIVATAFAYEGWIVATSINSELKDSKRNLPKALIGGTVAIVIIYIAYFIGLAGSMPTSEFMTGGEAAVKTAFTTVLGNGLGSLLVAFIVVSCLGTLNGLMLGCTRGIYSLAVRGLGPKPVIFSQVDPVTKMPTNSSVFGLLLSSAYLFMWYGNFAGWWGIFLDVSELPIVTMYALYIPIFLWMMKNIKDVNPVARIAVPLLAICGSLFMIYAAFISHGSAVFVYLGMFAIIMGAGLALKGKAK